jgi:amino acid adenylation domain-containing protein
LSDAAFADAVGRHAAARPGAEAVVDGAVAVSYAALDRRASAVAAAVTAAGAGPEVVVGVLAERSWEAVAALCGVLRAGAAFLLLDGAYPPARLQRMMADAGVPLVLGHRRLLEATGLAAPRTIELDGLPDASFAAPVVPALPAHLAYVVYTSGSTGAPKGIAIERRGLDNLLRAGVRGFGIGPDDRVLHFASVGFDGAVWEVLGALHAGGTVVVLRRTAVDVNELAATIREGRATVAILPPTLLRLLEPGQVPSLRTVVSTGEACTPDVIEPWLRAGRRLINAYGPAESSVCSTIEECRGAEEGPPPIGRPLDGVAVHVLDDLRPVEPGCAGGLYIGGPGIARGYVGQPGLTARRFLPDPLGPPGARLYDTGDRGLRRPDGRLEFIGRTDAQVKLRGQRIELEEVQRALLDLSGVADAAATVARVSGDERLVAYVVPGAGGLPGAAEVRTRLAGRLPAFMVPSLLVRVEALPLTPNGKVDRSALRAPEPGDLLREGAPAEAPRTPSERLVAEAFAEVLVVGDAGPADDFVALGGDSLAAMRTAMRLEAMLGRHVSAEAVLQHRTVEALAAHLDASAPEAPAALPPITRRRSRPG